MSIKIIPYRFSRVLVLFLYNGYLLPGIGIGFGTVLRLGTLTGPAPILFSLNGYYCKIFCIVYLIQLISQYISVSHMCPSIGNITLFGIAFVWIGIYL